MFAYTYVLCCADNDLYIGSTDDLRRRVEQHRNGYVPATKARRPIHLVYYEACLSLEAARQREQHLKTGYGGGLLQRDYCALTRCMILLRRGIRDE